MNLDKLLLKFPLETEVQDIFFKYFSTMKENMTQLVVEQVGMELPDKTVSEICQIFFYVVIDIESELDPRYNFGIELVNRHLTKQVDSFRKVLVPVANDSISRGVPQDYILEYLCFYYQDIHNRLFPNEQIIL